MYDDLIKRLRSVKDSWQTDEESWMLQAADAIEELSKQHEAQRNNLIALLNDKPRWIPVSERVPDGEVLAINALKGTYGFHEYLIGYIGENHESDTGFLCESEGEILLNVTHWMPLPKPPESEET